MDFLPVAVIALIGVNTLLWASVGAARAIRLRLVPPAISPRSSSAVRRSRVAVLIPAHDEAAVIAATVRSARGQVPVDQIFVVSDGSSDDTARVASAEGANVIELAPNRGKAGAIVEAIARFRLVERFDAVLLLDADTRLDGRYLESGLPAFDDPGVVAVAGRATSILDPPSETLLGRLLVAYRERFYVAVQYLLKYGQAARSVNVVSIVPGFASMYRTGVLDRIEISAPGLVIEDFNMTFELHAKRLGRIAFHPGSAIARTQDPDRLVDYVKQMRRWTLGFWQTVRRHRVRPDRFWAALGLYMCELLVGSTVLLVMLALLVAFAATWIWASATGDPTPMATLASIVPPAVVVAGILVPDLLLTLVVVAITGSPGFLRYALAFPLVRAVDAVICIRTLVEAFRAGGTADGRWTSPLRRAQAASDPTAEPGSGGGPGREPGPGTAPGAGPSREAG
ncbi:glycosyltransferase family 2 protein [Agromyces sp. LHK192]|uniref:glycosyltransferase family 2 protein n=1 Tax=Agromyces sp. LHK192 TaxID=2498704 RepID=UPI000FD7A087|nr:glycosyltransferase family 2 protein [Agromyces sp. LHK192]